MKRDEVAYYGRTMAGWHQLVAHYFEAETSEQEECELKCFLATEAAADASFDEVKAVMGVGVMGRRFVEALEVKAESAMAEVTARKGPWRVIASVAASLLLCVASGVGLYAYTQQEVYVAYINGVKYSDSEQVWAQLNYSIEQMAMGEAEEEMTHQLREMLGTLTDHIEIN